MINENILTEEFIEVCHNIASLYFKKEYNSEPMPKLTAKEKNDIINLVSRIHNSEYYSNKDKPIVIWYEITKQHILVNGNKRMAVICFIFYTKINNIATNKIDLLPLCKEIAESSPDNRYKIIEEIKSKVIKNDTII